MLLTMAVSVSADARIVLEPSLADALQEIPVGDGLLSRPGSRRRTAAPPAQPD
jgi:hypothetical protein